MKKVKVKALPKKRVIIPEKNKVLKGEKVVPLNQYWARRIKQGDVEVIEEEKPKEKAQDLKPAQKEVRNKNKNSQEAK